MYILSKTRKTLVVLSCIIAFAIIIYGLVARHFYYPYAISALFLFVAGLLMFKYRHLEVSIVSGVGLFAYAFLPFFFAETVWIPDIFNNEYLIYLIVISTVLILEGIALIISTAIKSRKSKKPKTKAKSSTTESEITDDIRKQMQSYNTHSAEKD